MIGLWWIGGGEIESGEVEEFGLSGWVDTIRIARMRMKWKNSVSSIAIINIDGY